MLCILRTSEYVTATSTHPMYMPLCLPPLRARGSAPRKMAAAPLGLLRMLCADVRRGETGEAVWSESWAALHHLCPDALAGAATVLDQKSVTRVVAQQSRREYFLVDGNGRSTSHTVVPGFCTCMSYCLNVASKPDALVCKHELAVMLAEPLGMMCCRELEDDEWARRFSQAMTMPMMTYDHELAAGELPQHLQDQFHRQPAALAGAAGGGTQPAHGHAGARS